MRIQSNISMKKSRIKKNGLLKILNEGKIIYIYRNKYLK